MGTNPSFQTSTKFTSFLDESKQKFHSQLTPLTPPHPAVHASLKFPGRCGLWPLAISLSLSTSSLPLQKEEEDRPGLSTLCHPLCSGPSHPLHSAGAHGLPPHTVHAVPVLAGGTRPCPRRSPPLQLACKRDSSWPSTPLTGAPQTPLRHAPCTTVT